MSDRVTTLFIRKPRKQRRVFVTGEKWPQCTSHHNRDHLSRRESCKALMTTTQLRQRPCCGVGQLAIDLDLPAEIRWEEISPHLIYLLLPVSRARQDKRVHPGQGSGSLDISQRSSEIQSPFKQKKIFTPTISTATRG